MYTNISSAVDSDISLAEEFPIIHSLNGDDIQWESTYTFTSETVLTLSVNENFN